MLCLSSDLCRAYDLLPGDMVIYPHVPEAYLIIQVVPVMISGRKQLQILWMTMLEAVPHAEKIFMTTYDLEQKFSIPREGSYVIRLPCQNDEVL